MQREERESAGDLALSALRDMGVPGDSGARCASGGERAYVTEAAESPRVASVLAKW